MGAQYFGRQTGSKDCLTLICIRVKINNKINSILLYMFFLTRFRVLERENIEFSQFGMRDNVAQLAVLEVAILLNVLTNYFLVYA